MSSNQFNSNQISFKTLRWFLCTLWVAQWTISSVRRNMSISKTQTCSWSERSEIPDLLLNVKTGKNTSSSMRDWNRNWISGDLWQRAPLGCWPVVQLMEFFHQLYNRSQWARQVRGGYTVIWIIETASMEWV